MYANALESYLHFLLDDDHVQRPLLNQTLVRDDVDVDAGADGQYGALGIGRCDSCDADLASTAVLVCASELMDTYKFGHVESRASAAFVS